MSLNNGKITCTSYIWKSEYSDTPTVIGTQELVVYPDDPKFVTGRYHCVV